MATAARKIKVASNPTRRRNAPPRAQAQTTARRRKNTMTAAEKRAFVARMAKARKKASGTKKAKRRNPTPTVTAPKVTAKKNSSRRKASNPATKTRRRSNPERRNPNLRTLIGPPKVLITQAVVGLLSAVATRQLPQMAMQASNAGWKGYAANAATTLATTWAAGEFLGPAAAQAALIGGTVILLDRVLTEKVSPIGKYLSLAGLGDATAAPGLGTIADGYFIHPTVVDAQGRPIIPHEITDAAMAAARSEFQPLMLNSSPGSASSPAAMGTTRSGSRFRSRF